MGGSRLGLRFGCCGFNPSFEFEARYLSSHPVMEMGQCQIIIRGFPYDFM